LAAVTRLAEERDPLYAEVADLVVDVDERGPDDIAALIAARLAGATGATG
jgi:hypothetical protein